MVENNQVYQAALQNSVYFHQPKAGFLRLGGADRVDFLQRQTTNDLGLLTSDRHLVTVLTSSTARILDVLGLINQGDTLGVFTLPGRQTHTADFLRSRIFFSDQVSICNLSADYAQILLIGPQSAELLQDLGISPPEPDSWISVELAAQPMIVIAQQILFEQGYMLLVSKQSVEALLAALSQAGSTALPAEVFEILRIEVGQPGPVGELTADYTPLEMHLQAWISESKGCYTGQEIIARQINYDKIAKHLIGVRLVNQVEVGAEIQVEGRSVGVITSETRSPRFGLIGLGVVRRPFHQVGKNIVIATADDRRVAGWVSALPFETE